MAKVQRPEVIIETLKKIDDKLYHNMADVEKGLGRIR